MSTIINKIIFKLRSSILYRYHIIVYFFGDRKKDYKELVESGYSNIQPVITSKWRFGDNEEKFYRRYYIGEINEKKYFLKLASLVDGTLSNEIIIYKYLSEHQYNSIFKLKYYSNKFRNKYNLLIIEYKSFLKPINEYIDKAKLLNMLNELLDNLFALRLIHADINLGNIMLDSNNQIVIFDFGISSINKKPAKVNYLVHSGTYYKEINGKRIYDDAYSILCILDVLSIDKELEGYIEIEKKVGRYCISINL